MCQFDCFKGYPDNRLKKIGGAMSGKVFLEEVNIWIGWSEADCSPECGWASSNQATARLGQRELNLLRVRGQLLLPDPLRVRASGSFLPRTPD